MRVLPIRLPYKGGDKYQFVLAGDFHFGSAQCDYALIKKFVDKYAGKDKTLIFLMGDEIDSIATSDKRYDSMAVHEKYRGERNFIDHIIVDFNETMSPLKGQIIAGVDSNHNKTYRKLSDSDPHYRISKSLGFERLGYGGWVCAQWYFYKSKGRGRTTSFHISHGKPTVASTPGGSINTLATDAQWFLSDVVGHGHTHRLSAGISRIFFEPDARNATYRKRKQHLVQTGSFLKSYSMDEYSPYSEVKRYPPIDLGWACVDVSFEENTEPRIQCSVREY